MEKWLKNNHILYAISLIFAIMLWMMVTEKTPTASIVKQNDQVNYIDQVMVTPLIDDNKYTILEISNMVDLMIEGSTVLFNQIRPETYKVYVDLTTYTEGEHYVPVQVTGFPNNLKVRVIPEKIRVVIDLKQSKEMAININYTGTPLDGFQIGKPEVTPSRVIIKGAKTKIEQIAQINAYVNINNVQEKFSTRASLIAVDKNSNEVEIDIVPKEVLINIPVISPHKLVPLELTISSLPPANFAVESIQIEPKEVALYATQQELDKYEKFITPTIDLSNVTKDQMIQLKLPIPPGINKLEPNNMVLYIHVVPEVTQKFTLPITIIGLKEGLQISITEPLDGKVDVVIGGAKMILDKLKPEDIKVELDVSNLDVGEYQLPVKISTLPLLKTPLDINVNFAISNINGNITNNNQ